MSCMGLQGLHALQGIHTKVKIDSLFTGHV